MRSISLVLVFFVAFGTLQVTAEPLRKDHDERVTRARITRVIKSILRGIKTTGDGLIPPLPAPPPQP